MFNDSEVYCDFSTGTARPLITAADKKQVFSAFHALAHPGVRASRQLIAARVVWKGMAADINRWCRYCQQCQRGKVTQLPAAAVQAIPVPEQRFHHIHVDIVGPLPVSKEGFAYMLTAIDRTTRWLEVIPMRNMDAVTCADAFVTSWITRFGVPALVTTDRGTSAVWTGLCRRLGITQLYTTAYHPQANGMVERAHRQIKDALRSCQAEDSWPEHLPWVLLGLRASPKDDSAVSSVELAYGAPGQLPHQNGDLVTAVEPPPQQQPPLPTQKLSYAQTAARTPPGLMTAEYVYIRRGGVVPPLAPLYQGPFRVLRRGPKVFYVQIGGSEEAVSVDRLKPHLGGGEITPAVPARRGHPRSAVAATTSVPVSSAAVNPADSTAGGSCSGT
jgi:transposase InsO family protein